MPLISLRLAYRWLNIDTYWELTIEADPDEVKPSVAIPPKAGMARPVRDYPPELLEKYPLQNRQQSGTRRSSLHEPLEPDLAEPTLVEHLINQLQADLTAGNLSDARARVSQIDKVCAGLPLNSSNILFQAEALLACGLAYRSIGENSRALEYFEKGLKGFSGQDSHAEAMVRWMIGVIQLETPKTLLNDGLLNWQAAWKIFATAAGENRRSKAEGQWYQRRGCRMFDDLQEATKLGALPPSPASAAPASGSAGPVPASAASGAGGPPPASSGPARPTSASTVPASGSAGPVPASAASGAGGPPPASSGPARPTPTSASAEPPSGSAGSGTPASASGPVPPAPPPPVTPPPQAPESAPRSTRIFVTVPTLGPIIIGGSETPKAEGELFWSHDLKTTMRLVSMLGGKKPAMVMERVDGVEFPVESGIAAEKQRLFSEETFDQYLECQKWIWLPLPRPAGAALRFVETISPPSQVAAWLQLAGVPVYNSVAADPWGTGEARARENQHGSLTFPWVYFDLDAGEGTQKRYCLHGFKNQGLIRLNSADKYAFMRVIGNSMNAASPFPICAGDWVLVCRVETPDNFRIVVANVIDASTGDRQATLKRKHSDGLYSESDASYPVVPFRNVDGYVGEVVAIAKPDAGTLFQG